MSDDNEHDDDELDDDEEQAFEIVMENAERLQDLAMALCYYNDEMAKQSLAIALGTLAAHYEEPCLHELMDIATARMEAIQEELAKTKNDNDAGNN